MSESGILAIESEFLLDNADDLFAKYGERFLLIKGPEVHGAYDTPEDAINAGVERFPDDAEFLVRSAASPKNPTYIIPALAVGAPITCPQ